MTVAGAGEAVGGVSTFWAGVSVWVLIGSGVKVGEGKAGASMFWDSAATAAGVSVAGAAVPVAEGLGVRVAGAGAVECAVG